MRSFIFQGIVLMVDTSNRYSNGRLAIVLATTNGGGMSPYHTLTVNIPEVELEDGEFCVKTWSEAEDIAEAARASGVFEDTGKRVIIDHVEAEIWRLKEDE